MRIPSLALAVVTVFLLAGCGGSTKTVTEPAQTAEAQSAPEPSSTPSTSDSSDVSPLGDTVKMQGTVSSDNGADQALDIRVTVERVVTHAKNPYVSASSVEAGTRWARALVEMENVAPDTYSIAAGQFTMVDDDGGEAGTNFSSAPWHDLGNGKLLSGDKRRGWVGFLVPKGHKITEVRWEPFIGGDLVHRWDVTSG